MRADAGSVSFRVNAKTMAFKISLNPVHHVMGKIRAIDPVEISRGSCHFQFLERPTLEQGRRFLKRMFKFPPF